MISFLFVIFLNWSSHMPNLTRFLVMPGLTSWRGPLRLLACRNRCCGWSECGTCSGAWLLSLRRLGYDCVVDNILAMDDSFAAARNRPNTMFNLVIVCGHLLDLFCLRPASGARRICSLVALPRNFSSHRAWQTFRPLADWRLCDAVGGRFSRGRGRFFFLTYFILILF